MATARSSIFAINRAVEFSYHLAPMPEAPEHEHIAHAPFEHRAMLIFDTVGKIRFCSAGARALLGRSNEKLLEHPVWDLFPGLPIQADTPGYNAAFVGFWFGAQQWRAQDARNANGGFIALEIAIEGMTLGGEHRFVVAMRRRGAAEAY